MVVEWSGAPWEWVAELTSLKGRMGGVFQRSEGREMAGAFLDGLLCGAERKTGWLMAEPAGLERVFFHRRGPLTPRGVRY